jgi:hypothetical protein
MEILARVPVRTHGNNVVPLHLREVPRRVGRVLTPRPGVLIHAEKTLWKGVLLAELAPLSCGAVGPVAVVANMMPGVLVRDGVVGSDVGAEGVPLLPVKVWGVGGGWTAKFDFRDVLAVSNVSLIESLAARRIPYRR